MSLQLNADEPGENIFESSARALSQFCIRALALPATILLVKPRDILQKAETRTYRPLPSPFLLALIAGVFVAGVFGSYALTWDAEKFYPAVANYFAATDGVKAVLFALPFVAVVWVLAALISLATFRGLAAAERHFAILAFCLSAMVFVAAVQNLIIFHHNIFSGWPQWLLAVCLWIFPPYVLILAVKAARFVAASRQGHGLSALGATLGATVAFAIVSLFGGAVWAVNFVMMLILVAE